MNYNNFRRGRSPPPPHPFNYNGAMRPMPSHREFDNPYHPANPYEGPGRLPPGKVPQGPMSPLPSHPNQLATPMTIHPYMDVPAHQQNYSPHYREQLYGPPQLPPPPPQPSNSYRTAIGHRDPYMSAGSSHPHHQVVPPVRSSSPPYKILCITNINHKINDGSVKDALTNDFSRFGDISVSVCHDNNERLAYIYFRNSDEAREARQVKMGTLLFDKPIEIEPIYEPARGIGSPGRMSPNGPILPPAYSPRKRSVSPSGYPRESNMSIVSNRRQPIQPAHLMHGDVTSPSYPHQRGSTPPDYGHGPVGYHHGLSPSSPMAPASIPPPHERRPHHGAYNPYPPSYSSPPRGTHRPIYSSHSLPYPSNARERPLGERMHVSSRSPHRDPYYPVEPRNGGPAHHHNHHPSVSASSGPGRYSSRSSRHTNVPPGHYRDDHIRHRYPPEPPARYMSREYRREKFGSDPYPGDHDEGRPSRVLLVNNIDATKTELDLKEVFEPFGTIEEIEVRKVSSDVLSALVKFSSMDGAYKAKTANNGRHIGAMRCRIVYGKVSASRRLWIGGLSPTWTISMMEDECGKYGDMVNIDYTSGRPYCYVEYETANQAQFAAYHMRTTLTPASERKIRIEFVDPERSEKLLPRQNSQVSETSSKPHAAPELTGDVDASPRSTGDLSGRKRSISPASDLSSSKRLCPSGELPLAANTFKQERLVAAAAAKARTSSTTSSTTSQSIERIGKIGDTQDSNELNNNSDIEQFAGNNGTSATRERAPSTELASQEAPSLSLLSQCTNIRELVACCSVSWPSQIALRNFIFPAQIFMCSGRKQIIDRYLSRPCDDNGHSMSPLLRITQRWRLHPQPKLEEVKRRMQSGNLGILILTARHDNLASGRQAVSTSAAPESLTDGTSNENVVRQQDAPVSNNQSADQAELRENGPPQQNGNLDGKQTEGTPSTPVDKNEDATKEINSLENSAPVNNSSDTSGVAGPSTPNHAGTPPTSSSSSQSRPLRNLISYLEQKDAAGVISLSASVEGSSEHALVTPDASSSSPKLLYAFPPGDFALNILKRKAPNLIPEAVKEEFLLGVVVGGNVDAGGGGKM